MTTPMPIEAIYERGLIRPLQPLVLPERTQVYVFVVPSESQPPLTTGRLQQMHALADEWLAHQPKDAVRPPRPLSPVGKARLDAELDDLLAEVDLSMRDGAEEAIVELVDEAADAARHGA